MADADTGLNTFVEGTKLMVVGKLRSLSDRHGRFRGGKCRMNSTFSEFQGLCRTEYER